MNNEIYHAHKCKNCPRPQLVKVRSNSCVGLLYRSTIARSVLNSPGTCCFSCHRKKLFVCQSNSFSFSYSGYSSKMNCNTLTSVIKFTFKFQPPSKNIIKRVHFHGPCLQLRERNRKIIFLFINQNTCCGYSKEPSQ